MADFAITSITLRDPLVTIDGAHIVANFSFDCDPFTVIGARLIRIDATGAYSVLLPSSGRQSRVFPRGHENKSALKRAAFTAYAALTGASAVPPPATADADGDDPLDPS